MLKLLLVDDDNNFLSILKGHLAKKGFDVVTACGVNDAIGKLTKQKFDVICSDYNLNDGNGIEIFDYIKLKKIDIKKALLSGTENTLLEKQVLYYGGVFLHKGSDDFTEYFDKLTAIF